MEYRRFENRVFLRVDPTEEIIASIEKVCQAEQISLAEVTGIGAVYDVDAGYFAVKEKKYYSHAMRYEYEMTSLMGTVTQKEGRFYAHLHINVADQYGVVRGGHLRGAKVSATAEIVITIVQGAVGRAFNEKIGLNLFDFAQ